MSDFFLEVLEQKYREFIDEPAPPDPPSTPDTGGSDYPTDPEGNVDACTQASFDLWRCDALEWEPADCAELRSRILNCRVTIINPGPDGALCGEFDDVNSEAIGDWVTRACWDVLPMDPDSPDPCPRYGGLRPEEVTGVIRKDRWCEITRETSPPACEASVVIVEIQLHTECPVINPYIPPICTPPEDPPNPVSLDARVLGHYSLAGEDGGEAPELRLVIVPYAFPQL
jgi:hypothetical protein